MTVSGLYHFLLRLTHPRDSAISGHFALITRESCDCIIDNTLCQSHFFFFLRLEQGCYLTYFTNANQDITHRSAPLWVLLLRVNLPFTLKGVCACQHNQSHIGGTSHCIPHLKWCSPTQWIW